MFECPIYAHIPSDKRTKNDPKAHRCIFLNFGGEVKGFKLWDPLTRKLIYSRVVTFDEGAMLKTLEYQEITDDGEVTIVKISI